MFNDFQGCFQKYKDKLLIQKDLENKILDLLTEISGFSFKNANLKINQRNKTIEILNLSASKKFFVSQRVQETSLPEKIKSEFGFKLKI